jgi:hypothetical protein
MWKRIVAAVLAVAITLSPTASTYWLAFLVLGGAALSIEWLRGTEHAKELRQAA